MTTPLEIAAGLVTTRARRRSGRPSSTTIRIRARIEGFDRERYRIGPKWTAGWLARVQQLAPVVATEGTIDVNLFAMEPQAP